MFHHILDELHKVFLKWGTETPPLLKYSDRSKLNPQVSAFGCYKPERATCPKVKRWKDCKEGCGREKWFEDTVKNLSAEIDKDRRTKMANGMSKDKLPENRVVCLTRTNKQLNEVADWCKKMGIPCRIRRKGGFYQSDAILDFCAMIEGCLYEQEPMYLYNRSMSSYIGKEPNYKELSTLNGNPRKIRDYLYAAFGKDCQDVWDRYNDDFRKRPVMAVLRDIVTETDPVGRYVSIRKKELAHSLEGDSLRTQTYIDARQYEADLNKLISILTDRYSGDYVSLLDICRFLRVMIETEKKEEQATPEQIEIEEFCVDGMTVHSAKGLEFDNVLIPFMCMPFEYSGHDQILVSDDKRDIGWSCKGLRNKNFLRLYKKESWEIRQEEARLLYVAMTRAKNRLYCFDSADKATLSDAEKWSDLI